MGETETADAPNALAEMSFEDAMAALEEVVNQLESGRVDLERSIALYERGAALRAHCEARLNAAELRVQQIVQDETGAAVGLTSQPETATGARA